MFSRPMTALKMDRQTLVPNFLSSARVGGQTQDAHDEGQNIPRYALEFPSHNDTDAARTRLTKGGREILVMLVGSLDE